MPTLLPSIGAAIRSHVSDRASRLIAGTGLCLTAGLILLGLYLCLDLRDDAWRNAERNADDLLALIEEAVALQARTYDLSLRETAALATRPDIVALDPGLRRLAIFDSNARSSGIGMSAITDAEGQIQLTSDPEQRKFPNLGDIPAFKAHRADRTIGLIISAPDRSRLSGRSIVRLSRRIDNPDGSFAGIVVGALFLDYFQTLFQRLHIDDGNTVTILHRDGTIVVRAPYDTKLIGRSIAGGDPYREFRKFERGRYLGHALLDGKQRLYVFANIRDLPLMVSVAVSVESIRAAWIQRAAIVSALILSLSALVFGMTVLLQREVGRRAAREASSRAANAELSLLARTDGLTGLPNRRSYDEVLTAAWQRAIRTGEPLSLLIVDADNFKQFNDRFGHHRGDAVLKAVAGCLRHALDPGAISCRIGGEEFAVILPGLDAEAAQDAAERVRRAVVNLQIAHAPEVGSVATVSVGLASASPRAGASPDALFAAADGALYAAKSAGRNRVRAAPPPEVEPAPLVRRA